MEQESYGNQKSPTDYPGVPLIKFKFQRKEKQTQDTTKLKKSSFKSEFGTSDKWQSYGLFFITTMHLFLVKVKLLIV